MSLNLQIICLIAWFLSLTGEPVAQRYSKVQDQEWVKLTVVATAYNSLPGQGAGNPRITAFGDTLKPGLKSIAVSRDLLRMGLTQGTPVKIKGLEGVFVVNDKMHSRWKKKIDIYMGENREEALEWGRRKVDISFPKIKKE